MGMSKSVLGGGKCVVSGRIKIRGGERGRRCTKPPVVLLCVPQFGSDKTTQICRATDQTLIDSKSLTEKPVECRVRYAGDALAGNRACLADTTSREDAVDLLETDRLALARVAELQPTNGAGADGSLVGRGGRRNAVKSDNVGLESGLDEVKERGTFIVKVVVAEELECRRVGDLEVGLRLEGARCGDVALAREHRGGFNGFGVDQVERDVLVPENGRWQRVKGGPGEARPGCPGVQVCDVVENGEGTFGYR